MQNYIAAIPYNMIENIFKKITEEYCEISPEAIFDWSKKIKFIEHKKKHLLSKEGSYSSKFYYIIKGAVKAYYLLDGKQVTDWFAFDNDFIPSTTNHLVGQKSNHFIELLEDSILVELTNTDLEELCKKHHDFEHLYRLTLAKVILL